MQKHYNIRCSRSTRISVHVRRNTQATEITEKLSDYGNNKTHFRHIHINQCKDMGLKIEELEADSKLQDLVLTAHHCYMHTLMNTNAFKIIENHIGTAFVKLA